MAFVRNMMVAGAMVAAGIASAAPDMALVGGLQNIPAGTGEGRLHACTLLPDVPVNTSREMKLRIHNVGDAVLNITLPLTLIGPESSSFVVTQPPAASVQPGQSTPLVVTFSPTVVGEREAVMSIASNDSDVPNFLVSLVGVGVSSVLYQQPDIRVTELTAPVRKCNSKGVCSISGTVQVSSTSPIPFTGGIFYVARMDEKTFSGRLSEPVAEGKVKKLKVWGGDPNFPAVKTVKYKIKFLQPDDNRFSLLVVPNALGADPDFSNNWVQIDIP